MEGYNPTGMVDVLRKNLTAVRTAIAAACGRAGRDSSEVTLVAVTKTVGPAAIRALYELGVRDFGENRVEAALPKLKELAYPDATWHMIGHLQSRKARAAVDLFDWVHSVDSARLAAKIGRAATEAGKTVPCLLEVNVSGEEAKYGVTPDAVHEAVDGMIGIDGIALEGLMTMAPLIEPEATRPFFARLRELRDRLAGRTGLELSELSMGMSNDYAQAIEEGATMVRIGSRLFEGYEA